MAVLAPRGRHHHHRQVHCPSSPRVKPLLWVVVMGKQGKMNAAAEGAVVMAHRLRTLLHTNAELLEVAGVGQIVEGMLVVVMVGMRLEMRVLW